MKDDLVYIKHILESIENVETFSAKLKKTSFLKDRFSQSAIIREFEIVWEATKNLSESFRKKYSHVEWTLISGFRDKLIHHYFGVNLERVWNIIKQDLPKLKSDIVEIKNELEFKK